MNKLALRIVLLMLLCGLVSVGIAQAQSSASYALTWHVSGSGGGTMGSTSYVVKGTAGQPAIGSSSSAQNDLCAGYWCGGATQFRVYLPVILRNTNL